MSTASDKERYHEDYIKRKDYFEKYRKAKYKSEREAIAYTHAGKMLEAIEGKTQLEQMAILRDYIIKHFNYKVIS